MFKYFSVIFIAHVKNKSQIIYRKITRKNMIQLKIKNQLVANLKFKTVGKILLMHIIFHPLIYFGNRQT